MTSYRVSRRAFLAGVGGAVGLKIMLRNLEAAAEGAGSPPRYLGTYWPNGVLQARWLPTGDRTGFLISPILAPFEAAGLRSDMLVLYGLALRNLSPGGGAQEGGLVSVVTGANSPGTRKNGGEADDSVAGGPSFDQIFLKHTAGLQRPELGSVNTIGDARVDSLETSAQCLSYGYSQRSVEAANGSGLLTENSPLLPETSPANLYARLFGSFVPGSNPGEQALRGLRLKKSVLDSSLRELARLRQLAPASERPKIDFHEDAVRKAELELQSNIDQAQNTPACLLPAMPSAELNAKVGSKFDYGNPITDVSDEASLEAIGIAHNTLIRAAFQCDLIRVATFQWCSANDHVAFKGMYPGDPTRAYIHHPMTHKVVDTNFFRGAPPASTDSNYAVYEYLCNVLTWFSEKTANLLTALKQAKDAFGNSLLDYTIVPYLTEVADPSNARSPMPALVFGGKALGMQGGQFVDLRNSGTPSFNALWLSIAQAYFPEGNMLDVLKDEPFLRSNATATAPIAGLWQKP
jgi:hypothetical protein